MRTLKQLIQRFAVSMGYSIEKATDKDSVQALITSLRPSSTDKNLIRLGSARDGGYLIPDDLEGVEACFSPGVGIVGVTSSFEEACAELGMKVFLADRSLVHSRKESNEFHATDKLIGPFATDSFMTMGDWVESALPNTKSDLLLQMDIEGAEYGAIVGMPSPLILRFRIIVIEFHWLHRLWNQAYYSLARQAFDRLLQHHTCVHIHPNNYARIRRYGGIAIPEVAEFTFLRNDRVSRKRPAWTFPHPMDSDNSGTGPHLSLPPSWYKG